MDFLYLIILALFAVATSVLLWICSPADVAAKGSV